MPQQQYLRSKKAIKENGTLSIADETKNALSIAITFLILCN